VLVVVVVVVVFVVQRELASMITHVTHACCLLRNYFCVGCCF
jgi:hypothetical protein